MTATLEDRLARSFQRQAERAGPLPAGLGDAIIRRGRRIRRRRRAGALVGVAALVAGAAVVASSVRTEERGLPTDSYATTVDPSTFAEGAASSIPYMIGSLIVDRDWSDNLRWDELEVRSVWEADGWYVVEAATPDVTVVLRHPVDGPSSEELVAGVTPDTLVVSADGKRYAWNEIADGPAVFDATDEPPSTSYPRVPDDLMVVGWLEDERGFPFDLVLQPPGGGPISIWDFGEGGEPRPTGVSGAVIDARISGVTLASIDGCIGVLNAEWVRLWSDCEWVPDKGAVSPSGTYVVGVDQSGAIVVKEAGTGDLVGTVTPQGAAIGELRWESDDSLVASITPAGGEARLARCAADSGECEWAGDAPPYDRVGGPVDLVLGHQIDAAPM